MAKWATCTAGAAILVVLGYAWDAQSRIPTPAPNTLPEPAAIVAPGRVEGATTELELRPQLAGQIEEVLAEEGAVLEQGELLLQLDDQQYRHQVALADAELAVAEAGLKRLRNGAHAQQRVEAAALYRVEQAELERAQLSWKRVSELARTKVIAPQQADDERTAVAACKAKVDAAKAHLELLTAPARADEVQLKMAAVAVAKARRELARTQLQRTKFRAPSRGRILSVDVEPGELTGPDAARPAIILADTSRLHVRAFIEEMDALRVKTGMAATIVVDGLPGLKFSGKVTRLSPRMEPRPLRSDHPAERLDTKAREVWIELAVTQQNQALVVGLPVDVTIDP